MNFQAFVFLIYLISRISNNCFHCQSILSVEGLCKWQSVANDRLKSEKLHEGPIVRALLFSNTQHRCRPHQDTYVNIFIETDISHIIYYCKQSSANECCQYLLCSFCIVCVYCHQPTFQNSLFQSAKTSSCFTGDESVFYV